MSKKTPQIRFKGFTDDWEERKFSNLAEVRRGLTYKPSDVQKYGIRVLRSSNIAEDTFLIKSDDVFVNKEAVKIDKVKNGDILITSANGSSRLVGKHALIEGIENDTVHGGFMLVARAEKPEFVNAIMSSSWYSKFINIFVSGGNGAIGNLSKSDLEDQKVYVPSEIEQTKIGLFFKGLDDTIALHQRKLDLLKEQKKGFLQKMFPKNGAKIPELRFEGFSDDWEERKLGDFVIDYVEKTTTQNQFPVLTSSQQQGIVLQETYFANRQVTTDNNIGYYVLPRGYFTFRNRSDNDVFIFNRNDLIDKGIISYFYPVFTLKNSDSDFFLKRINNGIKRQVSIQAEGTGQHVLSMKKFKNIISMFPSLEEQEKIGSFFKQLDKTIALHQRKLDLLKEQKKGFLQKMFVS
ncbi:restriction endonuclease subunit S [Leuconostoc mesenteroides]|uniref:restriction endonuclease subunit S n=1 Tax=Leuconostoc mesenteroides TaxID=1245 RepID=UPI0023601F3C|nr:restriction endonuclease subunit S [Leuconostoc mesenteroides]